MLYHSFPSPPPLLPLSLSLSLPLSGWYETQLVSSASTTRSESKPPSSTPRRRAAPVTMPTWSTTFLVVFLRPKFTVWMTTTEPIWSRSRYWSSSRVPSAAGIPLLMERYNYMYELACTRMLRFVGKFKM